MHVGLGINELAHDVAQIAVIFRNQNPYGLLLLQDLSLCRTLPKAAGSQIMFPRCDAGHRSKRQAQESSKARISAVFSFISASLPRDSTFRRTSGSVLELRRLKRHSGNSSDRPSVKSIPLALLS